MNAEKPDNVAKPAVAKPDNVAKPAAEKPVNAGYEHAEPLSSVIPRCPACGGAMQLLGLERWVGWRCVSCSEAEAAPAP
jgi:tRNA(Ile2) C34 agmatinyltransferase TiaS